MKKWKKKIKSFTINVQHYVNTEIRKRGKNSKSIMCCSKKKGWKV